MRNIAAMTRQSRASFLFLSLLTCAIAAVIVQEKSGTNSGCTPGFFPCNSSEQCVEQRRNCDGKFDCLDGSDEWSCEDRFRKDFWNNLFRKRPDEDREKNIEEGCSLSIVPKECRCSKTHLYCEHRSLNTVPRPLPEATKELDLSGNKICRIQYGDFSKLEQVRTLILTSSEVRVLEVSAFKNLPNLKNLYLSGNKLEEIRDRTFLSNVALELLVLSHNPLRELHRRSFSGLANLEELDLRSCEIDRLDAGIFNDLLQLKRLFLDENQLVQLPPYIFSRLQNLVQLSLSKNSVFAIGENVFTGLTELRSLSLAYNSIYHLDEFTFGNLSALYKLDLQGNGIKVMGKDTFRHLHYLHSLNLKDNDLKKVQKEYFDPLQELHYLYFDEFSFCSYAMHVRVCEPQGDGISSVAHLLDNILLRISVWIVAFLACVGNAVVLLGRLLVREPNEVHSFYIKNLALSDLLMGIYLFLIAAYDVAFRGEYILHEDRWRHSWQCSFSGFLSTTSSEASVFILTIITVDRYASIMYPLSVKRRTKKFAAFSTLVAWLLALLFSVLPLLNIRYYGDEFYGNNGVCLPLHIDKPFSQAWEYSTFIFCGVNMLAFFFIFFAYISMFFTISTSRIGLRSTQHHQQQDKTIAQRFAFIVATDFLCWVPIVILKILSIAGIPIDAQLNAWVAVFLLPVNSALNPILYTLTTKLFKQQIARIVYSCRDGVQPFARGDPFRGSRSSAYANQRRAVLATLSNNDKVVIPLCKTNRPE